MSRFFKNNNKEELSVRYSTLQGSKRSSESDDEEEDKRKQQEPVKRPKNSFSDDEEGQFLESSSQPSTSQPSTSQEASTSQPSTSAGPSSSSSEPPPIVAKMTVTVSEIQRKGKREEYVVVTMIDGIEEPFKMLRQYSEFQELDRRLTRKFKQAGHMVPELPLEETTPLLLRLFKALKPRMSANRTESMTAYLTAVVQNDKLRGDVDVQEFLTNTDPFQMLTKAADTGIFTIARYAFDLLDRMGTENVAEEAKIFREKHYFAGDFDACVRDLRAADAALTKARVARTNENIKLADCFKNLGIIERDSTIVRESFFALSECMQQKAFIERKYLDSGDDKVSKAFECHIKAMTELKGLYDHHKKMLQKWANAAKLFKDCIRVNEEGDAFIFQEDVEKLNFKLEDVRAELDLVAKNVPIETKELKNSIAVELKNALVEFAQKYLDVKEKIEVVQDKYQAKLKAIHEVEDTVPEPMNMPLHRY